MKAPRSTAMALLAWCSHTRRGGTDEQHHTQHAATNKNSAVKGWSTSLYSLLVRLVEVMSQLVQLKRHGVHHIFVLLGPLKHAWQCLHNTAVRVMMQAHAGYHAV